jgi:hypothetical protein
MNKFKSWLFAFVFTAFALAFFYLALSFFLEQDYLYCVSSLVTSLCCAGFVAIQYEVLFKPYG